MTLKKNIDRHIYFDYAATTPVDPIVLSAMKPYFSNKFGNPSAIYSLGLGAREALENSRSNVAKIIHALPENIIFTGSGTESDNLAIFGIAKKHATHGKHIVSIAIEHHAVLEPLNRLKHEGFNITFVKVDRFGIVNPDDVLKAIKSDTILVTIMYANNEIGSIQPIAEIGRRILRYRKDNNSIYPFFHSDACQAAGYLDLDVEKLHVDLMSFNGSKIYAPKGVGVLYLRRGITIQPMIYGGGQEGSQRSGTENIPFIVGLSKALEIVNSRKRTETLRLQKLAKYFLQKLSLIKNVQLNGPLIGSDRLPNNINVSFKGIEGEALLLYLDRYGIMCSTGSACTSESLETSHVLRAISASSEIAHGSLRFTLGKNSRKSDIDYTMKILPKIVNRLREISSIS